MTSYRGPFDSPASFVAIPRIDSLRLSPSGDRLVAAVTQLDEDGAAFVSSLWALDPDGHAPARQLTRSAKGESGAAFLTDDSLLFTSVRPRPSGAGADPGAGDEERPALWLLPAGGGEPWVVATRPGGVIGAVTGLASTNVVVIAKSAPGQVDAAQDREWWAARRRRKVTAALHESLRVRHWDHYLGPDEVHLYLAALDPSASGVMSELRDLTPDAGLALHDSHPVLTPDGSTVIVDWMVPVGRGRQRTDLVAIDTATGSRRTLAAAEDAGYDYRSPEVSPDGRLAVALRVSKATLTEPWVADLWLVDLVSGDGRAVSVGDEPSINAAVFNGDGSALIVTADLGGRRPLFRVDVDSGQVTRLTEEGAWASPQAAPNRGALYGLQSAVGRPPQPVRLDMDGGSGVEAERLALIDSPGAIDDLPGQVEEITTTAADGTTIRAWLVLPATASPSDSAPLLLWVHGGPVASWNDWHWRWNPWVLAARGWAVLLPDPALSSGYGKQMLRRGWGQWGGAPYDDVMALTDAALIRPDLDAGRTAMMGGSYGGYMANWIAGHTDRFAAIVSHASVWSLEQFQATTDWPETWADEWGYPATNPDLYRTWSPDRYADAIRTPMLVTHGERDYRCPVSESLRLWTDLTRRGLHCQFLWFGEENHWILKPGDSIVWYETVLAFLDHHVLGRTWARPSLL